MLENWARSDPTYMFKTDSFTIALKQADLPYFGRFTAIFSMSESTFHKFFIILMQDLRSTAVLLKHGNEARNNQRNLN